MDMRLFDKSPQVASLLVRLYDSHKVYDLARADDPLARAELTSAVTELLESHVHLNSREQELLSDVLIGLMRQAEADLRAALAERLSVIESAPLRLVLNLANDDIEVARPVLSRSAVLSDLDLIYIVKSRGPAHWQAIASRENLSPHIIDVLADKKDKGTAIALSENERIRLTHHALEILSGMAREHEDVAKPLLMRPEMPEAIVRKLYDYVSQDLRNYIRDYYGIFSGEVASAIDEIMLEFSSAEHEDRFMPNDRVLLAAHQFAAKGKLTLSMMMQTLKRGQITSFIAMFSVYTGIPAHTIHDYLRQSCGKGIAVICRAHGIQKNDFAMIYLLSNRMRSEHRIISQADMMDVIAYFDKIRPEVAQRLVRSKAEITCEG
ncbi:MAG: DUF2336 domain-containing protein [Micavibrio aeruginosavorus]|uniref:DUF2336 domain-containing protein n=1 Tax=Micavibrio aeruginosavorus TaxID=349221 RepID=A0A7T5R187_9BACT|nr:MAG: DUF2336 domain-containing protein [Micavibrio aeruginosavorus]